MGIPSAALYGEKARKNVQKLLSKMTGEHTEVFIENPLLLEHFCWLMRGFNNMAMSIIVYLLYQKKR